MKDLSPANLGKFQDPYVTATGDDRASVALSDPQTLWFNTGTLCNIACVNCYIESSPTNDSLVYITADEVEAYLDQLIARNWGVREIAFTGGEPFMNPEMIDILRVSLEAGYEVLVLTNAMAPMMRPRVQEGLLALEQDFPGKMVMRVSLDHHNADEHDSMRGKHAFEKALIGMDWLRDNGFRLAVAGRTIWGETEAEARAGYGALFAARGYAIDPAHPGETVLFPEMDMTVEVPEITTACWGILNKSPEAMMCASSRMVVKRKGAAAPTVLACTLLPYTEEFELGRTLEEAERAVMLNHPHCAKFCVLGGASCSG